jgi:serine/threonine protein kinase/predicted Zn-dependent protease
MPEIADRTESVFAAAVALRVDERAAYLDRECAADPGLRKHVEALLRAHDRSGHLLDRPVPGSPDQTAVYVSSEQPGVVVAGRYKLLEPIGEGGMGTVWVAEQTQPVRRKVAVKLIKAGMDSRSILARFEAERQALALMDHPNIAKVLDGGLTETGRPFFVMEYVKGVPITEYCDAARLSVSERLQLFVPVCQAIQHAHQKGIIHRDIKPSNILVAPYDEKAVPKVIDFGLAKAMHQSLTERTLHTAHETVLGTPVYMSPEQIQLNNLDVDTRSDIYSLGVLLYELLTGTTPLEKRRFKEVAWDEVRRIIREEEPPRPSTRLSSTATLPSLAACRQTEPARLTRQVRGELDWIVMKALEKDRSRRYESATGFAMDIQRYLADEPVLACPPSMWYRIRKFARRHRTALSAAAGLLLLLAVAAGGLSWIVHDRAWRRATAEQGVTQALDEAQALQGQSKWLEALAAARQAEGLLAGGDVDRALAQRVQILGADLTMLLRLEEIRRNPSKNTREDEPFTGKELQPRIREFEMEVEARELSAGFARAFQDYGIDLEELEPAEAAARIQDRAIRVELARALDEWAWMRHRFDKGQDPTWTRLLEIAGKVDPDRLRNRLRDALRRSDRPALEELAASVKIGELSPGTAYLLGNALKEVGAVQTAMKLLREAQRHHPGDMRLNDTLASFSLTAVPRPRYDDALRYASAALAAQPHNARLHRAVGEALLGKGAVDEALAEFSRSTELSPDSAAAWLGRADAHVRLKRWDMAMIDLDRAIRLRPNDANALCKRAELHLDRRDYQKASEDCSRVLAVMPKAAVILRARAIIRWQNLKDFDGALSDWNQLAKLQPKSAEPYRCIGAIHMSRRDYAQALAALKKAVALKPEYADAQWALAQIYLWQGKHKDALAELEPLVARLPKGPPETLNVRGDVYRAMGKLDEAAADYQRLIQMKPNDLEACVSLAGVYEQQKEPERAKKCYDELVAANSGSARAYLRRAVFHRNQGNFAAAREDCNTAVRKEPDSALPALVAVSVEAAAGRYSEAVAQAERALAKAPKHDGPSLYAAACVWSLASSAAARSGPDGAKLAKAYADRAAALLAETLDKGFHDLLYPEHNRMADDPALASIRQLPQVRNLLSRGQ